MFLGTTIVSNSLNEYLDSTSVKSLIGNSYESHNTSNASYSFTSKPINSNNSLPYNNSSIVYFESLEQYFVPFSSTNVFIGATYSEYV